VKLTNVHIKRPSLSLYDVFKEHSVLPLFPQGLMEEAQAMQMLAQHPHPNIRRLPRLPGAAGLYHRSRSRATPKRLERLSQHGMGTIDREPFMEALESAIHHLHSLGWAHNDLNPGNILVNEAGMPVPIDFGSSHQNGKKLTTSPGTKGWIDENINYTTSEKRHDISALCKIRAWLDEPTIKDQLALCVL
jgi:serine/threonine protein kinase